MFMRVAEVLQGRLCTEVCQAVELIRGALAGLVTNWGEVVAVNRRCPRCDGTRRALRAVVLVSGHAVFRGDTGPDHLQRVELAGHLEQRPRIFR